MTERTSDPSHDEPDEAPEGFREQPRYAPEVERTYANDRIEVTWEPAFCIHVAECLRGLPAVFDNQRRPWIIVDNGDYLRPYAGRRVPRKSRVTSASWSPADGWHRRALWACKERARPAGRSVRDRRRG
jgi:uncharacterized Fe-S cluster protein YjdI